MLLFFVFSLYLWRCSKLCCANSEICSVYSKTGGSKWVCWSMFFSVIILRSRGGLLWCQLFVFYNIPVSKLAWYFSNTPTVPALWEWDFTCEWTWDSGNTSPLVPFRLSGTDGAIWQPFPGGFTIIHTLIHVNLSNCGLLKWIGLPVCHYNWCCILDRWWNNFNSTIKSCQWCRFDSQRFKGKISIPILK